MDPVTAFILATSQIALGLTQQIVNMVQRQANGETITEADLAAEKQKTQDLLAQGDAMRSTPRRP